MFIGFWLIAPLAFLGIAWHWKKGMNISDKLLIGFLITYMLSLMPFFVTERYRLPMVPVLIVFASAVIIDLFSIIKRGNIRLLMFFGISLAVLLIFVSWPRIRFNYTRTRAIIGTRYLERALKNPQSFSDDIKRAIIELKWAVETEPSDFYAHYQLGKVYASIGYYSGAIQELEDVLRIDPKRISAQQALKMTHQKFNERGDIITKEQIPKTPYEQAVFWDVNRQDKKAIVGYKSVIKEDPYHFQSYNNLGILLFQKKQHQEAIKIFQKGLKNMPDNLILLYDLASAYYKLGNIKTAVKIWKQCLEIDPNCQPALEALEMINR
jgi:lipopolysaccharide biosynthesis regulator YciM